LERKKNQKKIHDVNTGILLINLGTPESPSKKDVRIYLQELLSSNRLIDINPLGRWILLNFFILPFRPRKSAQAYKKIWMDEGSPLLVFSQKLKDDLNKQFLRRNVIVELGMQCGKPSLKTAIESLRNNGCDKIVVLPLYPQYASSSYGSAIEDVYKALWHEWNMPYLQIIPPFFSDPNFVEAWAKIGFSYIEKEPDHVLFSFHGLPIRHLQKSDYTKEWCKNNNSCCKELVTENRFCYSAQCHHTAKLIAKALKLKQGEWSVSFQSRLGRDEWIKPYTESTLEQFAKNGLKRITVFCPSFVADCLETIEEIGMSAAKTFKDNGGEELQLVPSLNNNPAWVSALTSIINQQLIL